MMRVSNRRTLSILPRGRNAIVSRSSLQQWLELRMGHGVGFTYGATEEGNYRLDGAHFDLEGNFYWTEHTLILSVIFTPRV